MIQEITNSKHRWVSDYDRLTGCYNRQFALRALESLFDYSQERVAPAGITMLDIDRFKQANDVFGRRTGDEILVAIGHILKFAYSQNCTVCRFGGDEFVVLSSGISNSGLMDRARITRRAASLQQNRRMFSPILSLSATVGIAVHDQDGQTPQELLEAADKAVLTGKSLGGDRVVSL